MKILWHNIFALIVTLFAVGLLVKFWTEIGAFLVNVRSIGPGHGIEEQTLGILAFGLIGVCLVAVVRIVSRK